MDQLLISICQTAKLLGISRSKLYQLLSTGRLGPRPIKLDSKTLFVRAELEAWTAAGCPPREQWQSQRQAS